MKAHFPQAGQGYSSFRNGCGETQKEDGSHKREHQLYVLVSLPVESGHPVRLDQESDSRAIWIARHGAE